MAHKFTIEYDLFLGLFSKGDGRDHCLGVYDNLDQVQVAFTPAIEKVHGYYMSLPYNRRQRASWWVAVYVWKLDEDGELTNEAAWDELTEEEQHIVDTMNVVKIF